MLVLKVLLKRKWIIFGCVLLAISATGLSYMLSTPEYEAIFHLKIGYTDRIIEDSRVIVSLINSDSSFTDQILADPSINKQKNGMIKEIVAKPVTGDVVHIQIKLLDLQPFDDKNLTVKIANVILRLIDNEMKSRIKPAIDDIVAREKATKEQIESLKSKINYIESIKTSDNGNAYEGLLKQMIHAATINALYTELHKIQFQQIDLQMKISLYNKTMQTNSSVKDNISVLKTGKSLGFLLTAAAIAGFILSITLILIIESLKKTQA